MRRCTILALLLFAACRPSDGLGTVDCGPALGVVRVLDCDAEAERHVPVLSPPRGDLGAGRVRNADPDREEAAAELAALREGVAKGCVAVNRCERAPEAWRAEAESAAFRADGIVAAAAALPASRAQLRELLGFAGPRACGGEGCADGTCARAGATCCGDGSSCPAGGVCCGDGCCPAGAVCGADGRCEAPARCPSAAPQLCPDGTCAPAEASCCGGGRFCRSGACCGEGACCTDVELCVAGRCVAAGRTGCEDPRRPQRCPDGSCAPLGAQCCDGGRHCTSGTCCGDGACCAPGDLCIEGACVAPFAENPACTGDFPLTCADGSCAPAGAACCGDARYCAAGDFCCGDGVCCMAGEVCRDGACVAG